MQSQRLNVGWRKSVRHVGMTDPTGDPKHREVDVPLRDGTHHPAWGPPTQLMACVIQQRLVVSPSTTSLHAIPRLFPGRQRGKRTGVDGPIGPFMERVTNGTSS